MALNKQDWFLNFLKDVALKIEKHSLFTQLLNFKAVAYSKEHELTSVSKDPLGLFFFTGRDDCSHQVVGKWDQENDKEQNLCLRDK